MNASVKWIGGVSLVLVAVIALLLVAGRSLEPKEVLDGWLTREDVLADSPATPAANATAVADPTADYDGFDPVDPQARAEAERALAAAPDYDPNDPFVIKRVLPIEGPIRYGEWHWDDAGVPDGPLRITVDLQARVISVFRAGYEIGAAAAMLGTPAHPTPTGVFPILTKERHNVSEKYGNAPMPWTLRLTWDGIAIHGGSEVERGYASHGCIGVPDAFVSKLYDIAKVGDVVIVTDGVRTGVGGSLKTG
ncbi:L,D-transpeptidase [Aurantiacibacter xanthus]|uniref:L,D-transpeptidase n=1 Tax=Aurantiacibacter xanthus TaxID=1784712 RepID=A0A3A1NZ93_9SPHN|nr:L,D-transpeptidase family protein [Aurantiacibacter xanthus]RIV80457.1 L,D-transpeptidase [Aurantiacibacter xanthus]